MRVAPFRTFKIVVLCLALSGTVGAQTGGLLGLLPILGELPLIAPLTWIVQVMPLFFLAGGAAGP